jgi:hypothetical protein
MGVIQASLDFYSYREAWRHWREGRGFFNAWIRVKGRKLAQQIVRDSRPYLEALRCLDQWGRQLEGERRTWEERVRRLLADENVPAGDKRAQMRRLLSEMAERIRASADSLAAEFRPYIRQFADRFSETLWQDVEKLIESAGLPVPVPVAE